jgi:DNA-binding response OmpR family regulator
MHPVLSVLLVEDDEGEAVYIQKMLKRAEGATFDLRHAVSLKAALTLVEMARPDIVLLDLSLPDSHGYETATEFAKSTDVPFIVLTGNDDMQMAMRTTALGAQDYLIKGEVQAKPLERAILMAVRRATRQSVQRRHTHETISQLIPSDKASVAMLQPRVAHLLEMVEDLENFLHQNAPGLMGDVQALLDKHESASTIKEIRDLLRLDALSKRRDKPRRSLSDAALNVLDIVAQKGRASEPPTSWEDAEAIWDEVIAKGDARE